MEIFDVHRKDVHTFDRFMDLKKPGFGGPSSIEMLKDNKGNDVNPDRKLKDYQRKVERHNAFGNHVYNPTYKAMGGDVVHKQEDGKNPYDYKDSYDTMGIPTVDVEKTNEGMCNVDFVDFVLESAVSKVEAVCEDCGDCDNDDCKCDKCKTNK